MRELVCLAPDPWQSVPTRTQQLMSRMQGAEVLYFEPPEPRGGKEHKKPGRKTRPGVTVYTLPPVPTMDERKKLRFQHGRRRAAEFILEILRKRGVREPTIWCATPAAVHLLDFLPYRGLVYDCGRYWTGFPPAWESDLAIQADLVFAASEGLKDRLTPCSNNIAVVENGCNFPMFARTDIEAPEETLAAGRPLLGYAGTLWADLDYGPVFTAAAAHPDWWFMLVGRQEDSPGLRRLKTMERVILADRHPLIEVPDYIHQWDVCMDLRRGETPATCARAECLSIWQRANRWPATASPASWRTFLRGSSISLTSSMALWPPASGPCRRTARGSKSAAGTWASTPRGTAAASWSASSWRATCCCRASGASRMPRPTRRSRAARWGADKGILAQGKLDLTVLRIMKTPGGESTPPGVFKNIPEKQKNSS